MVRTCEKKDFELVAETQAHLVPLADGPIDVVTGEPADDVGLEDVVPLQFLAALVQDDELAVGAVDVVADDDDGLAAPRNELEELEPRRLGKLLERRNKEIANLGEGRVRSLRRVVRRLQRAARLQHVAFEEGAFAACEMDARALTLEKSRPHLGPDHGRDLFSDRRLRVLLEIAQDCKEAEQRHQSLLPVDDVERARRHARAQALARRIGRTHQHDGAEEIVGLGLALRLDAGTFKKIVEKLSRLVRRPGIGALINRHVEKEGTRQNVRHQKSGRL